MGRAAATGRALWLLGALLAGWAQGMPAGAPTPGGGPSESQRFAAFLEAVYQRELADRPQLATEFGSTAGNDRWDDTSEPALAAAAGRVRRQIRDAKTRFDYARLDTPAQLQFRVFVDEQQLLLDRHRWRNHFYALNQIVGLHIDVPGVLTAQQPLASEADALAYIRRIRAVKPAFANLVRHLETQARLGFYMPKSVYPLLIEGARNVISGAPHEAGPDSPIFADFKRRVALLALPPERLGQLTAAARSALREDLQPAYERLLAVLQRLGGRTPVTGGVWQLPQGDEFYAFLIRQFTTTDMTPAQIHEMGLAEVARSQAEIGALMAKVGFHGSVREFMAKTKADPANYFPDDDAGREAYLARARAIVEAMQARLPDAFAGPAPPALQVVRTDAYKEASSPAGFYEAGSADGSRPGVVYLNLADMKVMPRYEMEDLLYHEGVPGHHLQISTILLNPAVPRLRKVNEWWQDSAFVEGWGLYAERLGKELGFFQDPYAEFGLLSGELWRASRLVVDSGLHYKRWTRDQAIRYLNENTPSPEETNVRAVDRYLAVPGQATSFMVGMRSFVAERERARQALGSRFDLRDYHRVALQSGYVPLWALHQNVTAWIESQAPTTGAAPGPEPTSAPAPVPNNAALGRVFDEYYEAWRRLNPGVALSQGDYRDEDRFDDSLEEDWRLRMVALLDRTLQATGEFTPATLSLEDQISLAMLRDQITDARGFYGSPLFETARMLPLDHFQGKHLAFAADAAGAGDYPFKTVGDYDAALRRADRFARWADEAIRRCREGVAAGVVLPRTVVDRMLPQLRAHTGRPAERTEFWAPIAHLPPTFSRADRQRLARQYRAKITSVIEPAYQRLQEYFENDYLSHARSTAGLGQMPGGRALYEYDVRLHTTTRLTPEQIHALGIAEVARIESEFAKVQKAARVPGSLGDFFAAVRADASHNFGARGEILPAFEAARARIVGRLPRVFDVMPRAEFQIRALPESSRESQGNGSYAPAAADGSRPGVLWINTYAPGVADRYNVMTITLHEGYPGHHFQTSLAQEQTDLPAFRRFDFTDAYGEGWALYAESLGTELGLFEDPWDYYGHLSYAILRANRLVIDTGIHALGWDVDQGVRWMLDHSSMTRDQATAEVERYVALPAQALAYKLGELKIRELRRRAESELGSRFDLKAFHDAVLLGGSMPLTSLERRVERWISAERAR